jgi:hypothetical protein
MNMQNEIQPKQKTVVFDEAGETVEEIEASADAETEQLEATEGEAPAEEAARSEETQETPDSSRGKYRIGDRVFDTQEEALAYATSQVSALETENQVADAYRQGMRDALTNTPTAVENVTPAVPPAPAYSAEELYTDPQAFLDKYARKIKEETRAEIDQSLSLKAQSDQIWREFTDRHPALAEFRHEVEDFVSKNTTDVRAVIATKGRPASYDFIATKMKSRFQAYASVVAPKRELPNTRSDASPSSKAARVTQTPPPKKPLSFAEQLRSIRKRGT